MTRSHKTMDRIGAIARLAHHLCSRRGWLAPAAAVWLAAGPGAGVGQAQIEGFVSLSSVRFFLNWQDWGSRGFTGQSAVIANIEAGHPVEHQAYKGKVDLRIGWPFRQLGAGPNSVVNRNFSSMHATATVGAMVSDARIGFTDIEGIAPDATVLSASAGSGFDPATGGIRDFDMTALTFAALAVADQDFADSIATLLGVEPWQTATVINLPVSTLSDQEGQGPLAEVVNMLVSQFGVTVVTPAGDLGDADFIEDIANMGMQPFPGTVTEPGSAQNALTVGRTDPMLTMAPEESGRGPNLSVDWFGVIGTEMVITGMDCTAGMMPTVAMQRTGPQIVAPGTRIGLPGSPVIPATAPGATSVLFDFWEGTSFASSIVAGAAALVHDVGTRFGLPINALVTKAVILNSANQDTISPGIQATATPMGADIGEDDAVTFDEPWDERLGVGGLDMRRLLNQYIGPLIDPLNSGYTDILPGDGRIQSGEIMMGPDIVPPSGPGEPPLEEIRDTVDCIAFVDCGTFALKPVDIDMLFRTGRLSSRDCPIPGKSREDCEVGFVSRFIRPGTGTGLGGNLIPPPGEQPGLQTPQQPVLADGSTAASAPVHAASASRAPASPLVFPAQSSPDIGGQSDPPLFGGEDSRLQEGGGERVTTGSQRVFPDAGGSETRRISSSFGPNLGLEFIRTGWDYGTIGTGQLDIPIGFVPDGATIHVTLVWEREHRWNLDSVREAFLEALAAPQPLPNAFQPPRLLNRDPEFLNPTMSPGVPPPDVNTQLQLAAPTRRLRLENLDLELWRSNAGGAVRNQLIARGNAAGHNTYEHISVGAGPQAVEEPMDSAEITSGSYFARITWGPTDTGQGSLYDLGGMFAQDIQEPTECASLRAALPIDPFNSFSTVTPLENMFAGNVDYAIAWYVEAPRLTFGINFGLGGNSATFNAPGDINADGAVNNIDLNMVMGAIGTSAPSADFDSDGEVTASDVAIVLRNFGQTNNSGKINKLARKGDKVEDKIADINAEIASLQRELLALEEDSKKHQKREKKMAKLERKREKMLDKLASLEEQLGRFLGVAPTDTTPGAPSIFANDRN